MFQFSFAHWTRRLGTFALLGCLTIGCKKKDESSNTGTEEPQQSGGGSRKPRWTSDVDFARLRSLDQNNLKMIGLAMHNYASSYNNALVPSAICDAQGKPLLSWRVAILPYIEYDNLYKMFKLDEPWDSENNKKLIPMMPKTFLLPGSGPEKDGYTHYCVFVGPVNAKGSHPLFASPSGTSGGKLRNIYNIGNIPDGTSNTIMVAEAEEAVIWTKPEDLPYDANKPLPKIGYHWKNKTNVLLGDGSTFSVNNKVSEKTLRDAITADDGNPLGQDFFN